MTTHILKTWSQYWHAVASGAKNFEVRRDDRGFQCGDTIILRRTQEVSPYYPEVFRMPCAANNWETEYYDISRRISWILTGGQHGIEPGYVVLALESA